MPSPAASVRAQPRRLTAAEWLLLDDAVAGELVAGALIEEEVPSIEHEAAVVWLLFHLHPWARKRGGRVFGSAHKVALTGKSGRKPDVTMYLDGQKLPRRRPSADTPPSVAIEVVTPTPRDTKRDRVEKPDEYARAGVRSYWLIDPTMRTLEVFELGADRRYVRAKSASGGRVKIPGYPGLALDLDGLWAELDSLDG